MTGSLAADQLAHQLANRIEAAAQRLGRSVTVDGPAELAARARLEGLAPATGRTSTGGATHLLACADGWAAIGLARPGDRDLVPAWLALAGTNADAAGEADPIEDGAPPGWLVDAVARCSGADLAAAATVVGLPVGILGEVPPPHDGGVAVHDLGPADAGGRALDELRVVDLAALWAGPLAAQLLGRAGARVTKVESSARPDASRAGSPHLFAHLNDSKAEDTIDLAHPEGPDQLRAQIRAADVVIESSRPRALEQLGIVATDELSRLGGPTVWVSITGHGRASPRVAFGDDAAVAGGLVRWTDDGPAFAGDALADPLTGLAAAATALEVLGTGRRALVDASLAAVAAAAAAQP